MVTPERRSSNEPTFHNPPGQEDNAKSGFELLTSIPARARRHSTSGSGVAVAVGIGVADAVGAGVGVAVGSGVGVSVTVGTGVGVAVGGLGVAVGLGVSVAVGGTGVAVGAGVGVGLAQAAASVSGTATIKNNTSAANPRKWNPLVARVGTCDSPPRGEPTRGHERARPCPETHVPG